MDCRRSQKVISGQGDTSPSQETSVYNRETSLPSGNTQKVYRNPILTLTHGTTSFWVPLHSPLSSLSLLFSTNKIFLTSVVGACLCFHSQSWLRTLSTWAQLFCASIPWFGYFECRSHKYECGGIYVVCRLTFLLIYAQGVVQETHSSSIFRFWWNLCTDFQHIYTNLHYYLWCAKVLFAPYPH
jgi:hypothetical protein